jgi:Fe-S-cluster containining protein
MIDTFYLHLEFKNKKSKWSINLPFLCNKCGVCCTMEDFLTAGEVDVKSEEQPQVCTEIKRIFEELGKMLEADHSKYEDYIAHTPCPFLVNKACSIYDFRPKGCRLFPNTAFGLLTEDCPALTRFKKQRAALKSTRKTKEKYQFAEKAIKHVSFTEKQYQSCITKLRKTGITEDELNLFNQFNKKNEK